MQGNRIWVDFQYAYIRGRGKGQTWPRHYNQNLQRVKILSVYRRKKLGNKNETTYAKVIFLDWDGQPIPSQTEIYDIEAYDIVDFWDDFYGDHSESIDREKDEEKLKQERQARREREQKIASRKSDYQYRRRRWKQLCLREETERKRKIEQAEKDRLEALRWKKINETKAIIYARMHIRGIPKETYRLDEYFNLYMDKSTLFTLLGMPKDG